MHEKIETITRANRRHAPDDGSSQGGASESTRQLKGPRNARHLARRSEEARQNARTKEKFHGQPNEAFGLIFEKAQKRKAQLAGEAAFREGL